MMKTLRKDLIEEFFMLICSMQQKLILSEDFYEK